MLSLLSAAFFLEVEIIYTFFHFKVIHLSISEYLRHSLALEF